MARALYQQRFIEWVRHYVDARNPIRRFRTDCCALGQLSINNTHTVEQIQEVVNTVKAETKYNWKSGERDGGERALFVITTPAEKHLEDMLQTVGFKEIYEFNRRTGYPAGMIKMWIISW